MNVITIVGNLTKDPELRTTQQGKFVCSFDVAVNRRRKVENQPEADFFHVNAWNEMGENCAKYLSKGKKVGVVGRVSLDVRESNGKTYANMDVLASEVEFLSPKDSNIDKETGMQKVNPELPY